MEPPLVIENNMLTDDALDNPIWNALRTEHSAVALGDARARRYPPAVGPLSGVPALQPENYASLRELAGPDGILALFYQEPIEAPTGWSNIRPGLLSQMVCADPRDSSGSAVLPAEFCLRELRLEDVPAMVALAELTEPGPFRRRTIELGRFFGIFEGERLLAMAGQRLHLPQHIEVSAVCTHPGARGRGYARILMSTVMNDIRQRGKTPFLHTLADNVAAIRVYESLGFVQRRHLHLAVLKNET